MPQAAIAVFARAPVAGKAKTRLIPVLGARGAAGLQQALLRRTLATVLGAALGPVSLWCAPDCAHAEFRRCRDEFGVQLFPQQGCDLGERMLRAVTQVGAHGNVLVVGSDCPALTVGELRAAARALDTGNDVVLIPAEDGGYVLLGLRRPVFELFADVPWGTVRVLAITRERLHRAGLTWHELTESWDVDRPEDLARLLAIEPSFSMELAHALTKMLAVCTPAKLHGQSDGRRSRPAHNG
ncbi:MAG: TIGR04282 family arsenosugar biosynthesis glycosyltransferase [Proteobacteria bacterium]|nr:TIGR04282 family arsenosugar biosynthesis glycosyltransferase [Pseudomonadota bacterium]